MEVYTSVEVCTVNEVYTMIKVSHQPVMDINKMHLHLPIIAIKCIIKISPDNHVVTFCYATLTS